MREDFVSGLDPFAESIPGNLRVRYYMQRLRALAADAWQLRNLRSMWSKPRRVSVAVHSMRTLLPS